jgi:iodothyronine deiodinase-like protein
LNRIYRKYRDRVAFFVVYIQEAHPTDLWQMSSNVRDGVLFASPRTSGERAETAGTCVRKLAIEIPALVDGIDNRTERAYTGWPDRLYVIGADGRVRYKSGPGPFGFATAELEQSLEQLLPPANGH